MNHGTGGYRQGCRCDECRDARNTYQREHHATHGRPDRTPPAPARLLEPRPFWFQFASCRPEFADRPIDQWVDLFFPTRGESSRYAKEICAECPAPGGVPRPVPRQPRKVRRLGGVLRT